MTSTLTPPSQTSPGATSARPPSAPRDGTSNLAATLAEIERLGLTVHVAELEAKGFTVVPPELVIAPDVERLLAAGVRIATEESGIEPDLVTGATHTDIPEERRKAGASIMPFQEEHAHVAFKDRVFEEYVTSPTLTALVTYLLGEHSQLMAHGVWFRGPAGKPVPPGFVPSSLHSDNYGVPAPFPPYAQLCNSHMPLTDYTFEGGCIGFVPGSHKLQRHPLSGSELLDNWVPAEAPAGSLVVWHGNTWHTIGNPRTIPGLRVNLIATFCRPHFRPFNLYRQWVTQDMVDRNPNPARFATVMGFDNRFGRNDDPHALLGAIPESTRSGITPAPSWWD